MAAALRALPVLAGRELLVWGDVPAVHPELLAELPEGVTVCEWGYEDNHPFARAHGATRGGRRAVLGVPRHLELDVDRRDASTT